MTKPKRFQITREKLDYLRKRKQEDPGLNKTDLCAELGTTPRTLNVRAREAGLLGEVIKIFPPNKQIGLKVAPEKLSHEAVKSINFIAATMRWRNPE